MPFFLFFSTGGAGGYVGARLCIRAMTRLLLSASFFDFAQLEHEKLAIVSNSLCILLFSFLFFYTAGVWRS